MRYLKLQLAVAEKELELEEITLATTIRDRRTYIYVCCYKSIAPLI